MPITIKRGDIFESKLPCLTIPVNVVGVAGAGLALECKKRYPKWFESYKMYCDAGQLQIGKPILHHTKYSPTLWAILDFPTKEDWRAPSRLSWIRKGLKYVKKHYVENQLAVIWDGWAIPALGCGLGKLWFEDVSELVFELFMDLPIEIELYEPLE